MMRSKKSWTILVIVAIMLCTVVTALFILQAFIPPVGQLETLTSNVSDMQMFDQEKVLNALKDVVGVDVDKYTVNVTHYDFEPDLRFEDEDSLLKYMRVIIFNLESKESRLSISARISKKDNTLLSFDTSVLYGTRSSVHYINKLSSDPLIATKDFLSRLYVFTGDPIIKDMQTLVNPAENLGDMNKIGGNIKCDAMVYTHIAEAPEVHINFLQLFNGIESKHGLYITFYDGFFWQFSNSWNSRLAGSVEVNVSREQVVTIAQEEVIRAVGSADYTFPSDRPAITELIMMPVDRALDSPLYPFWSVTLYLVNPSDPWLGGWHVWIQADTGEVTSSGPIHGSHDLYP